MLFKNDIPPTSKEEAVARRVRPPPEKYDPDKLSHWSITMTVAWIIWGEIDAVRNEWDDYRNELCRLGIRERPHCACTDRTNRPPERLLAPSPMATLRME